MKKLLFIALLFLAGCATEANYRRHVNSFIGTSEEDLIAEKGVPDKRHTTKGKKFFEYKSSYTDAYNLLHTCNTTFILQDGIVENVTYRGNNCVRYPESVARYM